MSVDVIAFILFLVSIGLVKYILTLNLPSWLIVLLSAAVFYTAGLWLRFRYNVKGVFYLFRFRRGLGIFDSLAKFVSPYMMALTDMFSFTAFGILGFLWVRRWKHKVLAFLGGLLMFFLILQIYPLAFFSLLPFVKPKITTGTASFNPGVIFGISGVLISALFSSLFLPSKQGAVTPLIPGVTLPLLEGILALALVLIVHEFSHAIFLRRYGVSLKSAGLVFFGILPIGGFVEPEEKEMNSLDPVKKYRVAAAGPLANFITAIFIFPFLIAFLYLFPGDPGCLALNQNFTYIFEINGSTGCSVSLHGNGSVLLITDQGPRIMKVQEGKLGISYIELSPYSLFRVYRNPILQFFYNFLSLAFSLNLIIGIVNLLPVKIGKEGLDGAIMLEAITGVFGTFVSYLVSLMFFLLLFFALFS